MLQPHLSWEGSALLLDLSFSIGMVLEFDCVRSEVIELNEQILFFDWDWLNL